MTTLDIDKAVIDLANAATEIAGRYGLTASALFYALKTVETQVMDLRLVEYIQNAGDVDQTPVTQPASPPMAPDAQSTTTTVSMKDIHELLREKKEAGMVGTDGRPRVTQSEAEAYVRAKQNDNAKGES